MNWKIKVWCLRDEIAANDDSRHLCRKRSTARRLYWEKEKGEVHARVASSEKKVQRWWRLHPTFSFLPFLLGFSAEEFPEVQLWDLHLLPVNPCVSSSCMCDLPLSSLLSLSSSSHRNYQTYLKLSLYHRLLKARKKDLAPDAPKNENIHVFLR